MEFMDPGTVRGSVYSMMGTGFLLEVQEASRHYIAHFTRGAVESTWATLTPHRLKFLLVGPRRFR